MGGHGDTQSKSCRRIFNLQLTGRPSGQQATDTGGEEEQPPACTLVYNAGLLVGYFFARLKRTHFPKNISNGADKTPRDFVVHKTLKVLKRRGFFRCTKTRFIQMEELR